MPQGFETGPRVPARRDPADQAAVGAGAGADVGSAGRRVAGDLPDPVRLLPARPGPSRLPASSTTCSEESEDDLQSGSSGCTRSITRSPGCAWLSLQLRTLACPGAETAVAGFTTSLLDDAVIRMALPAAIEVVSPGVGRPRRRAGRARRYAADGDRHANVGAAGWQRHQVLARHGDRQGCHLLEEGGALLRIEDTGLGMERGRVARLNAVFGEPSARGRRRSTGRRFGFGLCTGSRASTRSACDSPRAARPAPAVAMVILPPQLLCRGDPGGRHAAPSAPAERAGAWPAPSQSPQGRDRSRPCCRPSPYCRPGRGALPPMMRRRLSKPCAPAVVSPQAEDRGPPRCRSP